MKALILYAEFLVARVRVEILLVDGVRVRVAAALVLKVGLVVRLAADEHQYKRGDHNLERLRQQDRRDHRGHERGQPLLHLFVAERDALTKRQLFCSVNPVFDRLLLLWASYLERL